MPENSEPGNMINKLFRIAGILRTLFVLTARLCFSNFLNDGWKPYSAPRSVAQPTPLRGNAAKPVRLVHA
jgi:hypothetical protein